MQSHDSRAGGGAEYNAIHHETCDEIMSADNAGPGPLFAKGLINDVSQLQGQRRAVYSHAEQRAVMCVAMKVAPADELTSELQPRPFQEFRAFSV